MLYLFLLYGFCVGAVIGSFFNALAFRIEIVITKPKKINQLKLPHFLEIDFLKQSPWMRILFSPSICPKCHNPIKFYHNLPIIYFFIFKGKCQSCYQKIAIHYPLVEFGFALLFAFFSWLFYFNIFSPSLIISACLLIFILLLISWVDIKTKKISDDLNLLLLWIGLVINSIFEFNSLKESVLTVVGCYLILKIISLTFFLIRKKQGLGNGDILLISSVAAWFATGVIYIIFLASLLAIISFIFLKFLKKIDYSERIAFAPFIASGCLIYSFYLVYVH